MGFSFVQTCPLGFQRPKPVAFMKALMESLFAIWGRDFFQLMALDHIHQHNTQGQKEDRGEQCLYGQDVEINTTNHEQLHSSINLKAELILSNNQTDQTGPHASNKLDTNSACTLLTLIVLAHYWSSAPFASAMLVFSNAWVVSLEVTQDLHTWIIT